MLRLGLLGKITGRLIAALVFIMADDVNQYTQEIKGAQKLPEQYWKSYEFWAQRYLDRPIFKGTPVSGKMMRNAAEAAYNGTGVVVPVDLALAQGQRETHFGLKGRKHKGTNPYNVGEQDNKTTMVFPTTEAGVQAYFNLIANDYLNDKSYDELKSRFVNKKGLRYATDPTYEDYIKSQTAYIQKWAEKVLEEMKNGRAN